MPARQAGAGCANSSAVGAAALLFLGTSTQAGGLGVPFRDGLPAAGGALTRVRLHMAPRAASGMDLGPGLGPTAFWSTGQSYTAQVWYRDNAGPCGSGSKLTSGLVVTMTP